MTHQRGFFLEVLAEFLELVARTGRFLLCSGTFLRYAVRREERGEKREKREVQVLVLHPLVHPCVISHFPLRSLRRRS